MNEMSGKRKELYVPPDEPVGPTVNVCVTKIEEKIEYILGE